MSAGSEDINLSHRFEVQLESLREESEQFVAVGILLIVPGMIAVGIAPWATWSLLWVYGALLILAGIAQVCGSFWSREVGGSFLSWFTGIVYLVVGVLTLVAGILGITANILRIDFPRDAALSVTLGLTTFLIVSGVFRIIAARSLRPPHWGWLLTSGILNVLLGLIIASGWPVTGRWVIGLFLGIELILGGCVWVVIALALRGIGDTGRAQPVV
jgi:uncharacterized membrane protein HdeD (DUF308 family)